MTLTIVSFRPELAPAFRRLNEAWITRLFALEAADRKVLDDPYTAIVASGGQIFFALEDDQVVGTVAAVREGDRFELAKMAVEPGAQGHGIGRRLGEAVLQFAREAGASRVFLLTNSRLDGAIRLYQRLGFRHGPLPATEYRRADVYMEWVSREATGRLADA